MRPDSQSHARAVISITINGAIFAMSRTKNTVCAVLEYLFLVFFLHFCNIFFLRLGVSERATLAFCRQDPVSLPQCAPGAETDTTQATYKILI